MIIFILYVITYPYIILSLFVNEDKILISLKNIFTLLIKRLHNFIFIIEFIKCFQNHTYIFNYEKKTIFITMSHLVFLYI